ncbi:transporter substrate-binding domain-containing protein [Desulfobacterales bacterium HSG17]|nr:transporter substrate-binding domain-containing protein [Desulfobacterales bacterium HSG17]
MQTKILCISILVIVLIFSNIQASELQIVSDPYPPLGYVNNDGEIVGITVEIIRALLKESGFNGKFRMLPWARAYVLAQTEKNILIYTLVKNDERERLFKLIGPVIQSKYYLYKLKKRNDIQLSSLNDAKKYLIGVVDSYYSHKYLMSQGFQEGENLDKVRSSELNLQKFIAQRFDLIICPEFDFNYQAKKLGYDVNNFEKAYFVTSVDAYIGFSRKTDDEIVKRFGQALKSIRKDKTYDKILNKYRTKTKMRHQGR